MTEASPPLADRLVESPEPAAPAGSAASPWLHRLAVGCVWVALVPIVFGALTTTQEAGMAVPDYPSTFGQNMFTYNMFGTSVTWDVFLEHTHRLGGSLIGLLCLSFFGLAMVVEDRRWMKVVAAAVLLGVISQGLLGGVRVLRDNTSLAMVHGFTAALFFALLCFAAAATSRRWNAMPSLDHARDETQWRLAIVKGMTLLAAGALVLQYLLGGALRHHQVGAVYHVGFALIAWLLLMAAAITGLVSGVARVRRAGGWLAGVATGQVLLGLLALGTLYGSGGRVVVEDSVAQVASRTSHMVLGVLLVAATSNLLVHTLRTRRLLATPSIDPQPASIPVSSAAAEPMREEVAV